jgi:predicted CoA-binding protein
MQACEFPTLNANKKEIQEIFNITKTIAVLGLSPDESKPSHRVAKYLQSQGFKIVPVYPKGEKILGEKVYNSLKEIPFEIDMVDIFRKPDALDAIVDVCIERGDIKVFWAQKDIINNKAIQKAKDAGMRVAQNMCTMVEHKAL